MADAPEICTGATTAAGSSESKTKGGSKKKGKRDACGECELVVGVVNHLTGKQFRSDTANVKNLHARHQEYSVEACIYVARVKAAKWLGTEMDEYVRPSTLYRPRHFDEYLNEKMPGPATTPAPQKATFVFRCMDCFTSWTRDLVVPPDFIEPRQMPREDAKNASLGTVGHGCICSCQTPVQVDVLKGGM